MKPAVFGGLEPPLRILQAATIKMTSATAAIREEPVTYTDGPLLIVIHGSDRSAENTRNYSINMAERCDAIVVAPLFDPKRFDDERYKRSCGVTKGGIVQPRDKWTFNIIIRLVAEVRKMEESAHLPYYVLGHSGGGQFVTKMAMFMPEDARGFVAANPGSYVFPNLDWKFPFGISGLPPDLCGNEILRRFCATPLTLFLGTADIYQNAADFFDASPEAMRQGPVRLARGHNYFEAMKSIAFEHGWAFNWRIVEVAGVGHSGSLMFKAPAIQSVIQALRAR